MPFCPCCRLFPAFLQRRKRTQNNNVYMDVPQQQQQQCDDDENDTTTSIDMIQYCVGGCGRCRPPERQGQRPVPNYRSINRDDCPLLQSCWDQDWDRVLQLLGHSNSNHQQDTIAALPQAHHGRPNNHHNNNNTTRHTGFLARAALTWSLSHHNYRHRHQDRHHQRQSSFGSSSSSCSHAFCRTNNGGRTALHLSTMPGARTPPAVLEALMSVNPHALLLSDSHKHGGTPVHFVCGSLHRNDPILIQRVVEAALNAQCDYNAASSYQWDYNAISTAPSNNNTLLTITWSDVLRDDFWSPLLVACRKAAPAETLQCLVDSRRYTTWIAPWTGSEVRPFFCSNKNTNKQQRTILYHSPLLILWQNTCQHFEHSHSFSPETVQAMRQVTQAMLLQRLEQETENKEQEKIIPFNPSNSTHHRNAIRIQRPLPDLCCHYTTTTAEDTDDPTAAAAATINDQQQQHVRLIHNDHNNDNEMRTTTTERIDQSSSSNPVDVAAVAAWVKLMVLLRGNVPCYGYSTSTTTTTDDDDDNEQNSLPPHAKEHEYKLSQQQQPTFNVQYYLLHTVACLYYPIPPLLKLVCQLYPEDCMRLFEDLTLNNNNNNNNNTQNDSNKAVGKVYYSPNDDREELRTVFRQRLPLHAALRYHGRWGFEWAKSIAVFIAACPESLTVIDTDTHLFPVLLGASQDASLEMIFTMLKSCPQVLQQQTQHLQDEP